MPARTAPMKRGGPIAPCGAKGKRTRNRDKKEAANTRALGYCAAQSVKIACGGKIQDAHIMRRGHQRTRLMPENRLPLCADHHTYFTRRPRKWEAFVRMVRPGLWKRLWVLAHHDVLAPKGNR